MRLFTTENEMHYRCRRHLLALRDETRRRGRHLQALRDETLRRRRRRRLRRRPRVQGRPHQLTVQGRLHRPPVQGHSNQMLSIRKKRCYENGNEIKSNAKGN